MVTRATRARSDLRLAAQDMPRRTSVRHPGTGALLRHARLGGGVEHGVATRARATLGRVVASHAGGRPRRGAGRAACGHGLAAADDLLLYVVPLHCSPGPATAHHGFTVVFTYGFSVGGCRRSRSAAGATRVAASSCLLRRCRPHAAVLGLQLSVRLAGRG